MKVIYFNFYNFIVRFESLSDELINCVNRDFNYFKIEKALNINLVVIAYENDNFTKKIPKNIKSTKQSANSITYDHNGLRYNDYYGEALTIFDYKKNAAVIYSLSLDLLHELSYLIILSRQGKWSDFNGLHKLHAMAVSLNHKNLILMMPMKGGKTSTFIKFIEDTNSNLISDDTPIINSKGEVLNFPIRMGIEDKAHYQNFISNIDPNFIYSLNRKQYGTKKLIDLTFFKSRITKPATKNILIQGIRTTNKICKVYKCSKMIMLKYLMINMILGIGLPMIIEYFIENTLRDHIGNIKIFFNRLRASLFLLFKSETYLVELSNDIEANFSEIKKML